MSSSTGEASFVYQMTPEAPFTPTDTMRSHKNFVYEIGSMLRATESRTVEFKQGSGGYHVKTLPLHVQKYGSAFLNSGGGSLCIGVDDNAPRDVTARRVVGVRLNSYEKDMALHRITDEFANFTPSVGTQFYEVEFLRCNIADHYVIQLHVREGDPAEIYSDRHDKMYIRRDGSIQGPLWPQEIKEIITTKFMSELSTASRNSSAPISSDDSNKHPLLALSLAPPVVQ